MERPASARGVGNAVWWVVKEVGAAIIAVAVGKAAEDGPYKSQKGKLVYQQESNQMLIEWKDGSTTLAPKEYQPRGVPDASRLRPRL